MFNISIFFPCWFCSWTLKQATFKFSFVNDGTKAVHQLQQSVPDFIFIDYIMPKMNGIECVKKIKHSFVNFAIPIILYSTNIDKICELAISEGASSCFQKTMSIKSLALHLKHFIL